MRIYLLKFTNFETCNGRILQILPLNWEKLCGGSYISGFGFVFCFATSSNTRIPLAWATSKWSGRILGKNGLINEFYFKMDIDFLSSFYPEMYFKDGFAIHVVVTRLDYYFIKKLEIGNKNCLGIILSYGLVSMLYLCIRIFIHFLFSAS